MYSIIPNIRIVSISAYLPPQCVELSDLASDFGEKEVANIVKATGIERVRVCAANETSSDMCLSAAQHLFAVENIDKEAIDGLIFISQTPDYILPATSILLQDRLGLGQETVCLDMHLGCSGYIYGLFQAALWIGANACKRVLLLAGDTSSKMINPHDKSLRMVFGDCGTATLIEKGDAPAGFSIHSDGSGYDRLIVPAGGFRNPRTPETGQLVYDQDKNGRTLNDLYMDGMAIFNFAIANVHKDINGLLEQMAWEKSDVELFALHQANAFMVNYIRKKLGVEIEKVPVDVQNYGNTGPATIPLLLADLFSEGRPLPRKAVLSGFGVGLSWGSVACNLSSCKCLTPLNK